MAWLIIAATSAALAAFWVALGRVLPPLARRLADGPRRGAGLNPHIPHPSMTPADILAAPCAVIWTCGCRPCPAHAARQAVRAAEWNERSRRP